MTDSPNRSSPVNPRSETPRATAHQDYSTPSTSVFRTPSCDSSGKQKSFLKKNKKGETVLHEFCSSGFRKRKGFSLEKLREMLADGANPNTTDGSGITPLHESIMYGNWIIMKTLLEYGAQVNGYNDPHDPQFTCTPLHTAVEKFASFRTEDLTSDSNAYRIITTLLDYGADVNLRDCFRRTPRDLAASNPEIMKLLRDHQPEIPTRVNMSATDSSMVVLPTVINKNALDELNRFGNQFKIKCLQEQRGFKLKDHVTHLIVPNGTKRANHQIRMGILSGCYVIKFQWVHDCLEKHRLLPADAYEIQDPLILNSREQYVTRKARLDRLQMRPKLFVGGKFFVMSHHIAPKLRSEITELILTGGGHILSREPKPGDHGEDQPRLFHSPDGSMLENCSVLILYAREPHGALYRMGHIKHMPLTWFLDCVDTYSIREE